MKFWLFKYYGIVIAVGILLALGLGFAGTSKEHWELALAASGALLSLAYFVQKQKLDETKLFNELFRDFNARYGELLDRLGEIENQPDNYVLTDDDKELLLTYFNLCSEEFLMYDLGYVHPVVWRSWKKGMLEYHARPFIGRFWDEEMKRGSYYGLVL